MVAAVNISNTVSNLFNGVYFSMGSAVAIIVGQLLGANMMKEAKKSAYKLIGLSVGLSVLTGIALSSVSHKVPMLYNTSDTVRGIASDLLLCTAACMPIMAFTHVVYFTLRSGGRTFITFLFDSCFTWLVSVPTAYFLSRYTDMTIIPLFLCVQLVELVKCAVGFIMVTKGIWIRNIINEKTEAVS